MPCSCPKPPTVRRYPCVLPRTAMMVSTGQPARRRRWRLTDARKAPARQYSPRVAAPIQPDVTGFRSRRGFPPPPPIHPQHQKGRHVSTRLLNAVSLRLRNAAEAADRPVPRLLAVSKTQPAEAVAALAAAGQRAFGENYVQEAVA